ncbi:MAG: hypothetical protein A2X08_04860 [Bacteroidetes bacterium GWA2_32_17]|nr:MAG: hypothetical protein A2X08_04860 [Bacteroidetes bacterium GWA2_32_17]
MKKSFLFYALALLIGFSMSFTSCKKKETVEPEPTPASSIIEVTGEITSNTTWTADKKYLLKGFVYVVDGVTLTINPGTIIKGDKTTMGTLIIERGAKIEANGTASQPIIFTSNAPVSFRNRGDWGGVVICGKAPVNQTNPQVEGGPRTVYGGTDPLDNSGTLKYVRIEYAGYPLMPDKELNGLTFCAVGSSTTIDYVMVSYSNDDSFEWFGGTVNCKHIVAYKGLDDDFDTDYGFMGKVQFAVSLRDKNVADISGSNGFESDNDAAGSDNSPFTHPIFSNVSVFGPRASSSTKDISANYKKGLHIRRNSRLCLYNSVIAGYLGGLLLDGTKCETNATNSDLQLQNVTIAGCTDASSFFSVASSGATWSASQVATWYLGANNDTLMSNSSLKVTDPWGTTPNFLPLSNSPLLGTASFTNPNIATGFDVVSYRGAFGTTDWLSGWANFDPQNSAY